jgi:hypothetical protein
VLRLENWCGSLISVSESQVFLLHLTAREFLLADEDRQDQGTTSLKSQHSVRLSQAHAELAFACVHLLTLLEDDSLPLINANDTSLRNRTDCFLEYAARFWGPHFRETQSDIPAPEAIRLES